MQPAGVAGSAGWVASVATARLDGRQVVKQEHARQLAAARRGARYFPEVLGHAVQEGWGGGAGGVCDTGEALS